MGVWFTLLALILSDLLYGAASAPPSATETPPSTSTRRSLEENRTEVFLKQRKRFSVYTRAPSHSRDDCLLKLVKREARQMEESETLRERSKNVYQRVNYK